MFGYDDFQSHILIAPAAVTFVQTLPAQSQPLPILRARWNGHLDLSVDRRYFNTSSQNSFPRRDRSSAGDRYLPRLGLFRFGNVELQDSLLHLGGDSVGVHVRAEFEHSAIVRQRGFAIQQFAFEWVKWRGSSRISQMP